MKDVHSPSPQPEDPDRALDPGLEEDPDTFVELVDRTFYTSPTAHVLRLTGKVIGAPS